MKTTIDEILDYSRFQLEVEDHYGVVQHYHKLMPNHSIMGAEKVYVDIPGTGQCQVCTLSLFTLRVLFSIGADDTLREETLSARKDFTK